MTSLWRCEVCYELIDPIENDERTVLELMLTKDGEECESTVVDLCEDCRPTDVHALTDWMFQRMGDER